MDAADSETIQRAPELPGLFLCRRLAAVMAQMPSCCRSSSVHSHVLPSSTSSRSLQGAAEVMRQHWQFKRMTYRQHSEDEFMLPMAGAPPPDDS